MDNKLIAEKVFRLQAAIRHKNKAQARVLQRAIIALLEHPDPLCSATPKTLRRVKGMGPTAVEWIVRILAGEGIEAIAADIPERKTIAPGGTGRTGGSRVLDRGNWDGSWDNVVRLLEGERNSAHSGGRWF